MTPLYVETSALLAWLFGQRESSAVSKAINRSNPVLSSTLTILEAERGVVQAESSRLLKAAQAIQLKGVLNRMISGWEFLEIDSQIRVRAGKPFPVEPVRALDAIHLSTILRFTEAFPSLHILTLDDRIKANLEPLGLLQIEN